MLQYDVHPFIGNSFGPITFMICVLGGLGNMIGGFVAAFIMSQIISIGGYLLLDRVLLRARLRLLFIVMIFVRPQGIFGAMSARAVLRPRSGWSLLAALPLLSRPTISCTSRIQILLWGFVYTAWSMMGRFGLVSLGHGAFLGVGAYVPALLWNYYGVTPWLGIPVEHGAGGRCWRC